MASEPTPIDPALRIDSVRLAVSDLARSADFYTRVLGLPPEPRLDKGIPFSELRSKEAAAA